MPGRHQNLRTTMDGFRTIQPLMLLKAQLGASFPAEAPMKKVDGAHSTHSADWTLLQTLKYLRIT